MKNFLIFSIASLLMIACKKDDDNIVPSNTPLSVTLHLQNPERTTITHYGTLTLTLTELNKNEKIEKTYTNVSSNDFQILLPAGSYEVRATGTASYTQSSTIGSGEVTAFVSKIDMLTATTYTIPLTLKVKITGDFIIEEIFITGTKTPQNKQYTDDSYIKIYNPTDETLYADGLLLVQSAFQTNDKQNYRPDIMNEAFTAMSVYQIPGSGKEYAVKAGEAFIIALTAIDHKENNPNSIDLRGANFEIYDSNDDEDVDNPSVPNVNVLFEEGIINHQAANAFLIARMPKGATLEKYEYLYTDDSGYDSAGDAVKIPNTWALDAVNLAQKEDFQWLVTATSLDSGWTYASERQGDESRYRNAVRRKVTGNRNGYRVLKDTNNSTEDFDPRVTPSLFK